MTNVNTDRIPLTAAALRLALTYQQVRDKLLRGELRGGRDDNGRLYADRADVERLAIARAAHIATPRSGEW